MYLPRKAAQQYQQQRRLGRNNNLEDCDSTDIVIFEPANRDKLVSERAAETNW